MCSVSVYMCASVCGGEGRGGEGGKEEACGIWKGACGGGALEGRRSEGGGMACQMEGAGVQGCRVEWWGEGLLGC